MLCNFLLQKSLKCVLVIQTLLISPRIKPPSPGLPPPPHPLERECIFAVLVAFILCTIIYLIKISLAPNWLTANCYIVISNQ